MKITLCAFLILLTASLCCEKVFALAESSFEPSMGTISAAKLNPQTSDVRYLPGASNIRSEAVFIQWDSMRVFGGTFGTRAQSELPNSYLALESILSEASTKLQNVRYYGFYTGLQYDIQEDLSITGQWSRFQTAQYDKHFASNVLSVVDLSLLEEARSQTARTLGLNWTMSEAWRAQAKVQTVAGSVWLPNVTIPRFVTQDSENWTLAAIELVYTF
jgi:hypothetical protein